MGFGDLGEVGLAGVVTGKLGMKIGKKRRRCPASELWSWGVDVPHGAGTRGRGGSQLSHAGARRLWHDEVKVFGRQAGEQAALPLELRRSHIRHPSSPACKRAEGGVRAPVTSVVSESTRRC